MMGMETSDFYPLEHGTVCYWVWGDVAGHP